MIAYLPFNFYSLVSFLFFTLYTLQFWLLRVICFLSSLFHVSSSICYILSSFTFSIMQIYIREVIEFLK